MSAKTWIFFFFLEWCCQVAHINLALFVVTFLQLSCLKFSISLTLHSFKTSLLFFTSSATSFAISFITPLTISCLKYDFFRLLTSAEAPLWFSMHFTMFFSQSSVTIRLRSCPLYLTLICKNKRWTQVITYAGTRPVQIATLRWLEPVWSTIHVNVSEL